MNTITLVDDSGKSLCIVIDKIESIQEHRENSTIIRFSNYQYHITTSFDDVINAINGRGKI